ncbi:MAG: class I SAM-dependent methyltransferase [Planctomycetota bacterium]
MAENGYQLLDSGDQRKLERFGAYLLERPSAQAVWERRDPKAWQSAAARFVRDSSGSGRWQGQPLPEQWLMQHAGLRWNLRPNDFGHLGIFPEQEESWRWSAERIRGAVGDVEVLNLFGYTGGSTLSAAAAGARVCHLDASKTSVRSARENAALSELEDRPVRWIVDDVLRFVQRETRRERRYHGIILDPPTYGRGARGETWQIEEDLRPLLEQCVGLLHDSPLFLILSSHSPGFTPLVLANLLAPCPSGSVECGEMVIRDRWGRPLPSGAYARWSPEESAP